MQRKKPKQSQNWILIWHTTRSTVNLETEETLQDWGFKLNPFDRFVANKTSKDHNAQ